MSDTSAMSSSLPSDQEIDSQVDDGADEGADEEVGEDNGSVATSLPFVDSAQFYDAVYRHKEYDFEVQRYRNYFPDGLEKPTVFDWGCGTGEFTRRLITDGCDVIGIEPNAGMGKIAASKSTPGFGIRVINASAYSHKWNMPLALLVSQVGQIDFSEANLKGYGELYDFASHYANQIKDAIKAILQPRDIAVATFNVMGYVGITNDLLLCALRNIRSKLKPGGTFLFDVIDASSAASDLIPVEWRTFECEIEGHAVNGLRICNRYFDPIVATIASTMNFWTVRSLVKGEEVIGNDTNVAYRSWVESHTVRTFSYQEIELALRQTGFALRHQECLAKTANRNRAWSVLYVAEAV